MSDIVFDNLVFDRLREIGDQRDRIAALEDEITRLREAIRRIAEQDATLSVCDGSVTVTMDATLTDEEKRAVGWAAEMLEVGSLPNSLHRDDARTLLGLLERLK